MLPLGLHNISRFCVGTDFYHCSTMEQPGSGKGPGGRRTMKRNWEAHELFRHIGIGRENAIQRPSDRSTDRALRKLISETNEEGKVVIINVGNGIYIPRPWVDAEMQELNEYVNKEKSRAKQIFRKAVKMRKAADNLQQFRNGQLSLDDYFGGEAWKETTSK